MATVPTTFTFSAGSVLTASQLNTYLSNAVTYFVGGMPLMIVYQTANQTLTTGTWTTITFDSENVDRDGMHSTTTNPGRATAQTAGYYWLAGSVSYASNATGLRAAAFAVNAGTQQRKEQFPAGNNTVMATSTGLLYLNVGDYATVQAFQSSGGNLATDSAATEDQCFFEALWVSS